MRFMREKILRALLELRKNKKVIVLLLMVLISAVCYYFYERSFGYFVNVKIDHILPKGRYIRGLYKTGDFYTMIDDYNDIYAINIDKNLKISLIEKDIEQKVDLPKFTKSVMVREEAFSPRLYSVTHIQLDNGNILFSIVDREGKLNIYVYDPLKQIVVYNYKSKDERFRLLGSVVYPLSNGTCLIYTKSNNVSVIEVYDANNNSLTRIQNPNDYSLVAMDFQRVVDGIYLFESVFKDYYYIYTASNHSLIKKEKFVKKDLEKYLEIKAESCNSIEPFNDNKFFILCSDYIPTWYYSLQYEWDFITKSFKYLPEKTVYIEEPKNINPLAHYPCGQKVQLSKNEYVVLGGGYSILIFSWPSKRSYIYNIDKGKFRQIKPLKKILYTNFNNDDDSQASGVLNIDSNTFIYYVDNLVQGFKRSRVW